jgi:hypothetical protein
MSYLRKIGIVSLPCIMLCVTALAASASYTPSFSFPVINTNGYTNSYASSSMPSMPSFQAYNTYGDAMIAGLNTEILSDISSASKDYSFPGFSMGIQIPAVP